MSTIQAITDAGLTDDLDLMFETYFKKDDGKAKRKLKDIVDKHGLQCPEVIREVGALQRAEILAPGIYKEFKTLNAKLSDGGNGQTEAAKPTPQAAPKTEPKAAPKEPELKEDEPKAEADVVMVAEDDVNGQVLTDSDEEEIREKLRKEEEAWRAKLAARERKLREQKIKKNKKKAQRLGLKAEEAAKIKQLKDEIARVQEHNKKLRAEMKVNNDSIKTMRAQIAEIRPKKPATDGGTKKKGSPSSAKVDDGDLKAAVTIILDFIKENPGSKSKDIKENTGVEGAVYNAAISQLKENGKIEQKGRGPFTNYTPC